MASETRKNRPYAPRMSKKDRRDQLLDVAVRIVRRLGAQAITMDAVAKAAGVTRPVVYRVFDDAGDLFDAMLDREEEAALAQLAQVLPVPGTGDPAELTVKALAAFLAAVRAEPERWAAILSPAAGMPEPMRVRLERSQDAIRHQIQALVRWALADEEGFDDLDLELVARGLQVLAEESGRLVLSDPEAFPPERIVRFAKMVAPRVRGGSS